MHLVDGLSNLHCIQDISVIAFHGNQNLGNIGAMLYTSLKQKTKNNYLIIKKY